MKNTIYCYLCKNALYVLLDDLVFRCEHCWCLSNPSSILQRIPVKQNDIHNQTENPLIANFAKGIHPFLHSHINQSQKSYYNRINQSQQCSNLNFNDMSTPIKPNNVWMYGNTTESTNQAHPSIQRDMYHQKGSDIKNNIYVFNKSDSFFGGVSNISSFNSPIKVCKPQKNFNLKNSSDIGLPKLNIKTPDRMLSDPCVQSSEERDLPKELNSKLKLSTSFQFDQENVNPPYNQPPKSCKASDCKIQLNNILKGNSFMPSEAPISGREKKSDRSKRHNYYNII